MDKFLPGGCGRLTLFCGPSAAAPFTFICRFIASQVAQCIRVLVLGEARHAR
jgi:hypothetical protein